MEFKNKIVIVTGASQGLGLGIATEYHKATAKVYICSRNQLKLDRAKLELPNINIKQIDCSRSDDLENYVKSIGNANGRIDILVNNVSGFGLTNDKAGFEKAFYGDIMSVMTASNAASEYMAKGSSIVNISSKAADMAHSSPAYAAMKAAINQYTLSQAKLLAKKGIRVNTISPGIIEFPNGYWEKIKKEDHNNYYNYMVSIAMRRSGTVEEIANVVLFLSSEKASYITGSIIKVDGGLRL